MRIVIDSNSKGWINFWRIFWGIVILFILLLVFISIEKVTGYDLKFETGFISACHILKYKWLK